MQYHAVASCMGGRACSIRCLVMPHPNVRLPPPTIFLAFLLASWLLHALGVGLPFVQAPHWQRTLLWAGWGVVLVGTGLSVWSIAAFRIARTAIMPMFPASSLVTTGPYRHSRNPMYVSLLLVYAGLGLIYNSAWPALFLPLVWILIHWVIRREERALLQAFGDRYAAYAQTVGRWF